MNDRSYALIKQGLDAASMRQKSISSNIANVNTEGYKADKVAFEGALRKALDRTGVSMQKTQEGHLGGASINQLGPRLEKAEGLRMNENGNNVDMDREMVNLAANEIYYSALVGQISRKLANMNYVINR